MTMKAAMTITMVMSIFSSRLPYRTHESESELGNDGEEAAPSTSATAGGHATTAAEFGCGTATDAHACDDSPPVSSALCAQLQEFRRKPKLQMNHVN